MAGTKADALIQASAYADKKVGRGFGIARRRAGLLSLALVAPLVVFIMMVFVLPLGSMLFYAVNNPEVRKALPATVSALRVTDGTHLPDDSAFAALLTDLRAGQAGKEMAEAGRRLNYEIPGFRSLLLKTARSAKNATGSDAKATLLSIDSRWQDARYWAAIRRAGTALTPYYLLAALDLRLNDAGVIVRAPEDERLFVATLGRTLWISFTVTLICLALAFPLANAILTLPRKFATLMLACVLLPFWTSLLVRTSSWIVVLQKEGIVNSVLTSTGIVTEPLQLVFNRTGLYIAMSHILLPFMVLPILSIMKGISPSYMRASSSLGAHPIRGFLRIYLPMTLPGVGAGCLLTFIISAGYYITPTLVGGANDQMLSYFIAFYANTTINWGMSAALGIVLLCCVLLLYVGIGRFIGISRIAGLE